MASLIGNCLAKLVSAKRITQKQADDALALYEGQQGRLYPHMGPASTEAASALEAAKVMAQAARERKLEAAKNAIRLTETRNRMGQHKHSKTEGLMAVLTRDVFKDGATGETLNVESHSEGILKDLMRRADKLVTEYRSRAAGLYQDTESVWHVVDELYGRDSGDDIAKQAAKGWGAAVQEATGRARREGRRLSVLEDWRLPQFWDTERVRSFSEAQFHADLMREIEGGTVRVMDKQRQGEVAKAAISGVVAQAYRDITLGRGQKPGGGFSNQLRVFRIDDPDAYRRLMSKYGPGDGGMHRMMVGHLGSMAREIAFVEVLGPNYRSNFDKLLQEAVEDDRARSMPGQRTLKRRIGDLVVRPISSPAAAKRSFDYLTGDLGMVESELMAGIFGGLRNIRTASNLGSAIIAAIPGDSVTATMAANYNAIPASAVLSRVVRDLSVNREGAEALARQMNLTAQSIMEAALGAKRFEDEIVGQNLTGRLAEAVIRAQGLQAWTEGLKRAFSMEFMGLVARQSGRKFENLEKPFRAFLERNGFTPEEWDKLRIAPQLEAEGARFFDVSAVEDRRLGDRLMSAVIDERQYAVIEPNARVKQLTTAGLKRGTFWGEMSRNMFMFKSFSMSVLMTHLMRNTLEGSIGSRVWRNTQFMLMMTLAGAVTQQTATIVSGKDPQPMDDQRFWAAAWIRGGGGGVYADLAYSGRTRGEQGLYEFFSGPVVGGLIDAAALATGGSTLSGRTLAQFVKDWTPGSNLWFSRLAVDRYIFDSIQMMIDEDWRQSFRRYEKRLQKDFGQKHWWHKGDRMPARPPDLANVAG